MNRFYQYFCAGLLCLLVVFMLVSSVGVVIVAASAEGDSGEPVLTVSSLLDGSFLEKLENFYREYLPLKGFFISRFEKLPGWFTLTDEAATSNETK